MNEITDEPRQTIIAQFLEGGPLALILGMLLIGMGIFHFVLSLRVLSGGHSPVPAGVHAILLFAGPCLVLLFVLGTLPTSLPGFFRGVDAHQPLKHALELTAFFGLLCLAIFVPNFFLSLVALLRRGGPEGESD